ncbi:hypothetical protein L1887_39152 [Cichorium endivia]|nr:hypothetical protein L1887_39152 [Cichorium endivia]
MLMQFFHHKEQLLEELYLITSKEGVSAIVDGSGPYAVKLEESSKGKWMYVALETSGLQQLGWATISCPFTEHTGVGDAEDPYPFDGKRVIKWNLNA